MTSSSGRATSQTLPTQRRNIARAVSLPALGTDFQPAMGSYRGHEAVDPVRKEDPEPTFSWDRLRYWFDRAARVTRCRSTACAHEKLGPANREQYDSLV